MNGFSKLRARLRRKPAPSLPETPPLAQGSADPDWVLAKMYVRERLVALRRNLEVQGLSHDETEGARCAIIELEGVLNFQKPSKMSGNRD